MRGAVGVVVWLDKSTSMSFPRKRESRKKHFLGHPEFISGYC
ncbi:MULTISPECIES: hypothetical protein [unclassified Rickettsia]